MSRWVVALLVLVMGATGRSALADALPAPAEVSAREASAAVAPTEVTAGVQAVTARPVAPPADLAPLPADKIVPPPDYAAIDAYAAAAPPEATATIESLAGYLTQPARGDREKARAIYRWITQNITYDRAVKGHSLDPSRVLAERRAVCHGYAVLYQALAEAAGLKVEVITGHSGKAKPGVAEDAGKWINHAWNAVEVDGRWQLLDCCWGAGYVNERGRFERSYTPHYFLTAPEMFVYDHLPCEPRWQLLDAPLTRAEYLQQVQVRPSFFNCGLRLVSHPVGAVEADDAIAVTLGAPADTMVVASLYRDTENLGMDHTFTERVADNYVIRARFPAAGKYVLRVFARKQDEPGDEYSWALDYVVDAHAGGGGGGFPQPYRSFFTRNCHLDGALTRNLSAGSPVEFSLTVPSAQAVMISSGGSFTPLPAAGARFTGKVPVAAGPVVVFAKFADRETYEGLLQYTAQ